MDLLSWLFIAVTLSTAAGHFKFYRMEKVETVEVKEFEMEDEKIDKTFTRMSHNNEQRGNFTNCSKGTTKFSLQWAPLVLEQQGDITVMLDMVAPVDFTIGTASYSASFPQNPDKPIVSTEVTVTCADIAKIVPALKCPIVAKRELKGNYYWPDLSQSPTGTYILHVNVTNENKEMFFCGRAEIEIKEQRVGRADFFKKRFRIRK